MPFTPGRMDASQDQTDADSFDVLEPIADGFRNYQKAQYRVPAEALLVDKAQLMTLTVPEMTVLVGGMRMLDTNVDGTNAGVKYETIKGLEGVTQSALMVQRSVESTCGWLDP